MLDILDYWHLDPNRQVDITTDNGANVLKVVRDLEWEGVSCFGHNLHLATTTMIDKEDKLKREVAVFSKLRQHLEVVSRRC